MLESSSNDTLSGENWIWLLKLVAEVGAVMETSRMHSSDQ